MTLQANNVIHDEEVNLLLQRPIHYFYWGRWFDTSLDVTSHFYRLLVITILCSINFSWH